MSCFCPFNILGQNEYRVLTADNSPVQYTYIYNKSQQIGTVSDENGAFILDSLTDNDTVLFSHLGYESMEILGRSMKCNKNIIVSSKTYMIDEVSARPLSAKETIERAKDMIVVNYPITLNRYKLHLNHTMFNDDGLITTFIGSLIASFKGYQKPSEGEYRLYEVVQFFNDQDRLKCGIPYHFDVFPDQLIEQLCLLKLDFVRKTDRYKYELKQSDDNYIHIVFEPQKLNSDYCHKGEIVVNPSNYAIENIEYYEVSGIYKRKAQELILPLFILKTKGEYTIDSGKTCLTFVKKDSKYHLSRMANEYAYRYVSKDGNTEKFIATNEVVNTFGEINNINELRQINMSFYYDLEEWNHNEIKRIVKSDVRYRHFQKYISKIKEKYPDLELEEE